MKLPSSWYAIGEAKEFSSAKPNALKRFGLDMVLWKTSDGQWILQEDRCPHRSAKLSGGWLKGDCVTYPFHGFQFNTAGECNFAPEIARGAPGLKVQTFPVREQNGLIWAGWGNPAGEPPWFSDLSENRFRYLTSVIPWKTHFSRCVENQLDHSHLPFVHRRTIGRGLDPQKTVNTNVDNKRVLVGLDSGANFEFAFGNIWILRPMKYLRGFIAFVPVSEDETLIYMRHYQGFVIKPLIGHLMSWLIGRLNLKILSQDHAVVLSQRPKNSLLANDEKLMRSDLAIRSFRKWLRGEDPTMDSSV